MIPTSEVELEVGQRVDLPNGVSGKIVWLKTDPPFTPKVGVDFSRWPQDPPLSFIKPLKCENLIWTGQYWLYGPRPWTVDVEEWDGDSWVAQVHETQQELTVSGPDADVIISRNFRGQGEVTLFKLHTVSLNLDPVQLVRGMERDLDGSRGLFFDLFNLEVSSVMRDFTFTDEHKVQLVLAFGDAWRSVFPDPIWWNMAGEGETWCSNWVRRLTRCSCL